MNGHTARTLRKAAAKVDPVNPLLAYKAAKQNMKRMNRRQRMTALAEIRKVGGHDGKNTETAN